MVLYKFKEPKQAEDKPKTKPRKTSDSKDAEDSSNHYDYMKQLIEQNNRAESVKSTDEFTEKKLPLIFTKEDVVSIVVIMFVVICVVIIFSNLDMGFHLDTIFRSTQANPTTIESHSEVVSEYSSFEGMQENGLPKKWIATVNKDHKYIDFRDLAKEYEYRDITRSLSFTVTEGDECIVESIYDVGFQTSWPAYDLCNDSNTKTYNLTVHVSDSDEIGTVQLVLTVEK